jgi:DNA polymerase-3 subunit delta'
VSELAADPREVPWHPRLALRLVGHERAERLIARALGSGKLHHAWMITGAMGIGKATLAYRFAAAALEGGVVAEAAGDPLAIPADSRTRHWIAARAHPDLFVLERQWDGKLKRLKTEMAVDDARKFADFFGLTASAGGRRVAIVDTADDLNLASSNALLKLIEEPPPGALILLVTNQPGRVLRTIRSRCMRVDLSPLTAAQTTDVLQALPLDERPSAADLETAVSLAGGSPGRGLQLLHSAGAKAFAAFQHLHGLTAQHLVEFANRFSGRSLTADDFDMFCELLENWVAHQARAQGNGPRGLALAQAHAAIGHSIRQTNALNLDRRQTVVHALTVIDAALKTA